MSQVPAREAERPVAAAVRLLRRPAGQRSLFGEMLDWMLVPLLLLWPISVTLTWLVAQSIAERPHDRELEQLVVGLHHLMKVEDQPGSRPRVRLTHDPQGVLEVIGGRREVQVLDADGRLIMGSATLPVPDELLPAAIEQVQFRDVEIGEVMWRVAYRLVPMPLSPGQREPLIQVGEVVDERALLATEILKGVLLPQYAMLPLAVLLVWMALSRGLAPLESLQQRIRRRRSQDLSPIDERDAPEEVGPLVRAINDLLSRLDRSVATQKRFLADAAHQLKTPLAGLRMQAELAEREMDRGGEPEQARRSLQQIARATQNATRMVNQLLAMARAEDPEQALRRQPVDLDDLASETVQDFVQRALDRRIDLGYEAPSGPPEGRRPIELLGQPVLVRELVRNLVDNALNYTPSGGSVTVRVLYDYYGRVVVLQVEDSGVGIPEGERELVFQPFYRTLGTEVDGSGLGLAIVREIVDRHGAHITIDDVRPRGAGHSHPGTRFTVRFPAR